MADLLKRIDEAIALTKEEDYLHALTIFLDVYGGEDPPYNFLISQSCRPLVL